MSVRLHHRFDGQEDAPTLLLSNSLGTNLGMWDEQVPRLAERFRVLRYDQRGHGHSPAPPGPYSIAELGQDALGLLDELELERVSVCGVSLGGMTGMWLAINVPDRIDRLALCCTSAGMPPAKGWIERAATVRSKGMAAVVEGALERWFTPAAEKERVERAKQGLLATPPEGYAGCCEAIAEHDLRGELESIRAPTLVIAAEDDPAAPPDHGQLIADSIDGARLTVLPDARHLIAVERPGEVADLVLEHLPTETPA
jgi:3-oxoadipate enol-lactonase